MPTLADSHILPPRSTIRIARIIARLNVGGPAIQAVLLTDLLRKRGYAADLLVGEVPPGEASMEYLAHDKNVDFVRVARLSRRIVLWSDLSAFWRIFLFLRRTKPAVVHTHTAKAGALGRVAAILAGVPVRVHTFHGHVFHGYFSKSATTMAIWIERLLGRYTDCIVSISESQRRDLVETYRIAPASKVVTVPLGFELDSFLCVNSPRDQLRRSLAIPPADFLVGWIGRLTTIKNPMLLLDVATRIRQVARGIHFVVVGEGEMYDSLRRAVADRELSEVVHLTGYRRDLADLYADLDAVVLTSLNEGTPLVLLEAMASAKPFVATNVGAVSDLMCGLSRAQQSYEVFENGVLTPVDDQIIAAALLYLYNNPQVRLSMGKIGREFVRSTFSADRLVSDIEQLYLGLVASKIRCFDARRAKAASAR